MIPEEIVYNEAFKSYLFKFLRENLKIKIWCDYDGCYSPQVNVSLNLCGEEIHRSSDYLLRVDD